MIPQIIKKNKHNIVPVLILSLVFVGMFSTPVFATQIFNKAEEIMKDVYTNILKISTISAVVCASIALLLMNFSKNGRTVDESRTWLKRIIIVWIVLNSLGFIIAYLTPFLEGGKWQAN